MRRYAFYRCLYGHDFIRNSVNSIREHVDLIFVFLSHKPWGFTGSNLEWVWSINKAHERWRDIASNDPKVVVMYEQSDSCINQVTRLYNERIQPFFKAPDTFVVMECDQVFQEGVFKRVLDTFEGGTDTNAQTRQIEIWRGFEHRVPHRPARTGVCLWNMKAHRVLPNTLHQGNVNPMQMIDMCVHNMGFAISAKTMRTKHDIAIAASKQWGDSEPDPAWYQRWVESDGSSKNLEIAKNFPHLIPNLEKYPKDELPKSLQRYYGKKL